MFVLRIIERSEAFRFFRHPRACFDPNADLASLHQCGLFLATDDSMLWGYSLWAAAGTRHWMMIWDSHQHWCCSKVEDKPHKVSRQHELTLVCYRVAATPFSPWRWVLGVWNLWACSATRKDWPCLLVRQYSSLNYWQMILFKSSACPEGQLDSATFLDMFHQFSSFWIVA